MNEASFRGTVTKGKFTGGAAVRDLLQGLPDYMEIEVIVREYKKTRSTSQNSYWFAMLDKYVVPVFREGGDNWSSFSVHEYIMNELGYQEVLCDPKGKLFVCRKHSKEFNTVVWEDFMGRGREFLIRVHGIALPLPNEEIENENI